MEGTLPEARELHLIRVGMNAGIQDFYDALMEMELPKEVTTKISMKVMEIHGKFEKRSKEVYSTANKPGQ